MGINQNKRSFNENRGDKVFKNNVVNNHSQINDDKKVPIADNIRPNLKGKKKTSNKRLPNLLILSNNKTKINCENNEEAYSQISGNFYSRIAPLPLIIENKDNSNSINNQEKDLDNQSVNSRDIRKLENYSIDNDIYNNIKANNGNLISSTDDNNQFFKDQSLIQNSINCLNENEKKINEKRAYKKLYIKTNNFVANPPKKPSDLDVMTKISILILCFSFFICLNVSLAFNISMLHIYYNFKFWCFLLNFLIVPFFISIFVVFFKSICKINPENYNIYIDILGMIFLIINCILVTSFCGIYENSISKLGINITFSIIGYLTYYFILYLLKKYCGNKTECFKYLQNLFNPVYEENKSITSSNNAIINNEMQ